MWQPGIRTPCQRGTPLTHCGGVLQGGKGWGRELQEETEMVKEWRRQEKRMERMEAGGGAPSSEQGQEVLPVLRGETS